MGYARDTDLTGGRRNQGVGKFLQGGGAGDSIVWVINVGPLGVNGKEGRGGAHGVPETNHRESSEAVRRQDTGDSGGGRRTRGSRNAIDGDLHRETAGNRGVVGGSTSLI